MILINVQAALNTASFHRDLPRFRVRGNTPLRLYCQSNTALWIETVPEETSFLALHRCTEPVTELFDEADLLSDIPYVASATRLPQKITDAPASVTIIDRDIIDASGAVTVPDLFRLVPGMQAYSVTRNRSAVTYHGMSGPFPNRLEVMINGRSIYLPMLFTVDWGSIGIALGDIRHIEVIRGSNVPAFGSNALLGAINIVTKSPVELSENSVSAMTGANGTHEMQFRVGGLSGDNFSFQLAGSYSGNAGSARYRDGLQNLFDRQYSEFYEFNEVDRRMYLRGTLSV